MILMLTLYLIFPLRHNLAYDFNPFNFSRGKMSR